MPPPAAKDLGGRPMGRNRCRGRDLWSRYRCSPEVLNEHILNTPLSRSAAHLATEHPHTQSTDAPVRTERTERTHLSSCARRSSPASLYTADAQQTHSRREHRGQRQRLFWERGGMHATQHSLRIAGRSHQS